MRLILVCSPTNAGMSACPCWVPLRVDGGWQTRSRGQQRTARPPPSAPLHFWYRSNCSVSWNVDCQNRYLPSARPADAVRLRLRRPGRALCEL